MTRESLVTSTDRLASAHSSCEVVSPREWTSHCCPVKLTTCFIRYCRHAVLAAADDMPLLPITPVVGANVSLISSYKQILKSAQLRVQQYIQYVIAHFIKWLQQ